MKIYTEEVWYCVDCPNVADGYGGPYCTETGRDLVFESDFPWWCPLPNLEEPDGLPDQI